MCVASKPARRACAPALNGAAHAFWPDDISLLDATHLRHAHIHSPRPRTELSLLALAVQRGGRLVRFDQRIPLSAVPLPGQEHRVLLESFDS